eukprot:9601870-Lingulodinium_polyedra.AAC.1
MDVMPQVAAPCTHTVTRSCAAVQPCAKVEATAAVPEAAGVEREPGVTHVLATTANPEAKAAVETAEDIAATDAPAAVKKLDIASPEDKGAVCSADGAGTPEVEADDGVPSPEACIAAVNALQRCHQMDEMMRDLEAVSNLVSQRQSAASA